MLKTHWTAEISNLNVLRGAKMQKQLINKHGKEVVIIFLSTIWEEETGTSSDNWADKIYGKRRRGRQWENISLTVCCNGKEKGQPTNFYMLLEMARCEEALLLISVNKALDDDGHVVNHLPLWTDFML